MQYIFGIGKPCLRNSSLSFLAVNNDCPKLEFKIVESLLVDTKQSIGAHILHPRDMFSKVTAKGRKGPKPSPCKKLLPALQPKQLGIHSKFFLGRHERTLSFLSGDEKDLRSHGNL